MIGKRKPQSQLFDVGNVYDLQLPPTSFYAQLAVAAPALFQDEMFAAFYSQKRGRPSVPPSDLALMAVLQQHDGVSDEEAVARTAFDLRWAAVLRRAAGTPFCAKSTFQLFRAHLVLHDVVRDLFVASIQAAKKSGLLKGTLRAAIDTKPILGRGAVKDTFNLLAEAIGMLARALAKEQGKSPDDFLREVGCERYAGTSLKGGADIDWSDEQARNTLLARIVADARLLLERAAGGSEAVREGAQLLSQILLQDVAESRPAPEEPATAAIKQGTAPGRLCSATDPEQRHGHKSKSKRFTGSKSSVVVDVDSQIVIGADVLAGDAPDNREALQQIEAAEVNAGLPVSETLGDCAYGDGGTRQTFADAERELFAKVPKESRRGDAFPKSRFAIDLDDATVTCPAGHTTAKFRPQPDGSRVFCFGSVCRSCPLRQQCTTNAQGRTLAVHAQEALLQQARTYQATQAGRKRLRDRVGVEHALARLSRYGIGQARYFGRVKTRFQLLMACTVANLRLVWNWTAAQPGSEAISSPPSPSDSRSDRLFGSQTAPSCFGGCAGAFSDRLRANFSLDRPFWGHFRAGLRMQPPSA